MKKQDFFENELKSRAIELIARDFKSIDFVIDPIARDFKLIASAIELIFRVIGLISQGI